MRDAKPPRSAIVRDFQPEDISPPSHLACRQVMHEAGWNCYGRRKWRCDGCKKAFVARPAQAFLEQDRPPKKSAIPKKCAIAKQPERELTPVEKVKMAISGNRVTVEEISESVKLPTGQIEAICSHLVLDGYEWRTIKVSNTHGPQRGIFRRDSPAFSKYDRCESDYDALWERQQAVEALREVIPILNGEKCTELRRQHSG